MSESQEQGVPSLVLNLPRNLESEPSVRSENEGNTAVRKALLAGGWLSKVYGDFFVGKSKEEKERIIRGLVAHIMAGGNWVERIKNKNALKPVVSEFISLQGQADNGAELEASSGGLGNNKIEQREEEVGEIRPSSVTAGAVHLGRANGTAIKSVDESVGNEAQRDGDTQSGSEEDLKRGDAIADAQVGGNVSQSLLERYRLFDQKEQDRKSKYRPLKGDIWTNLDTGERLIVEMVRNEKGEGGVVWFTEEIKKDVPKGDERGANQILRMPVDRFLSRAYSQGYSLDEYFFEVREDCRQVFKQTAKIGLELEKEWQSITGSKEVKDLEEKRRAIRKLGKLSKVAGRTEDYQDLTKLIENEWDVRERKIELMLRLRKLVSRMPWGAVESFPVLAKIWEEEARVQEVETAEKKNVIVSGTSGFQKNERKPKQGVENAANSGTDKKQGIREWAIKRAFEKEKKNIRGLDQKRMAKKGLGAKIESGEINEPEALVVFKKKARDILQLIEGEIKKAEKFDQLRSLRPSEIEERDGRKRRVYFDFVATSHPELAETLTDLDENGNRELSIVAREWLKDENKKLVDLWRGRITDLENANKPILSPESQQVSGKELFDQLVATIDTQQQNLAERGLKITSVTNEAITYIYDGKTLTTRFDPQHPEKIQKFGTWLRNNFKFDLPENKTQVTDQARHEKEKAESGLLELRTLVVETKRWVDARLETKPTVDEKVKTKWLAGIAILERCLTRAEMAFAEGRYRRIHFELGDAKKEKVRLFEPVDKEVTEVSSKKIERKVERPYETLADLLDNMDGTTSTIRGGLLKALNNFEKDSDFKQFTFEEIIEILDSQFAPRFSSIQERFPDLKITNGELVLFREGILNEVMKKKNLIKGKPKQRKGKRVRTLKGRRTGGASGARNKKKNT